MVSTGFKIASAASMLNHRPMLRRNLDLDIRSFEMVSKGSTTDQRFAGVWI
jgi:hypothetical protein